MFEIESTCQKGTSYATNHKLQRYMRTKSITSQKTETIAPHLLTLLKIKVRLTVLKRVLTE